MIAKIFEFSLRQRGFVLLLALGLIGAGIWAALNLPIDAVPDITNVQVQINTQVPALAPEEVEKQVTFPIETEMAGVPEMVEMRSISKFGLSQVTLVFKDGTDIYRTRQLIGERVQNVLEKLPSGIQPRLAPISTGLGEIYFYTVDYRPDARDKPAKRYDQLLELKSIQDWTIRPMLRTVPGVAEVNSIGGYEKQIVVFPDPQKLLTAGISFDELADAVGANVENAGGGVVQRAGEQVIIRATGRVQTTDEIANLPVKLGARATPLLVKDVAQVGIGSGIRTGAATENGNEALLGSALMLSGENSRLVAQRVQAKLADIQQKLPPGVEIRTVYNRSELVDRTIRTVEHNLFEGAVLVIVILMLLLGNMRAALIVAAAIPLSMLAAMIGMVEGRVSGNLMSLGAVDFGLIVDGAVVIAENIVRQLAQRQHQLRRVLTTEERLHTILLACKEVGRPMVFGVAIITIVYLPILSLTGIEGKMFRPMAITVMLAIVGALVLAVTLVPVLCSYFLTRKIKEEDNAVMRLAKRAYAPVLRWAMRARWLVLTGSIALFGLAVFAFTRLGAEFVPQLDEGSSVVMMIRTTSIGLDASIAMQERTEQVLRAKFPEIADIFSRIGTAEVATDPMGVNLSDTFILFKPQDSWRKIDGRPATKDELVSLMSKELDIQVPGEGYLFSQPIQMRFNELLEGVRADIAVKVFGEDYDQLEKIANEVRDVLETVPGHGEIEFDAMGRAPLLEITLNRAAMAKYNVTAQEVNKLVSTAMGGRQVGTIIEGNRSYDLVVRMDETHRGKLSDLGLLPLRTADGGLVALGKVATFNEAERVNDIRREFGQRRAAIMVTLRGRDVEGFVKEAEAAIRQKVQLPTGYYVEFGGQFKNLEEARGRLLIVVPVALTLIFLLIFAAFGSLRQALIIYSGIPLAVTGGVFALLVRGLPFSISAGIGFIALSGVAVLNGVVMLSYFNELRERGVDLMNAVTEGALTRLRPVLMTALVASLGFVPMAVAHGAGAEVQRPLATVVIGGILSSTFLTLVLLPTLYAWAERRTQRIHGETTSAPRA